MIRETLSAARDLGRMHEIAMVLIRWGFGDLVRRLGMSHALEKAGKALNWKNAIQLADATPPERIRSVMEELGPTFVKLGQMLATRVDMFSDEWIAEFEKLQDQVPALPYAEILPIIEQELGQSPAEVFSWIDEKAFAAASIAQVHRANLKTGERVILKIRRPHIRKKIDADLRLMIRMAEIAENSAPELKRFKPTEVVRQFTLSLRRELDLEGECRHAERIADSLKDNANIIIPEVYWQWTSAKMNVQEFIDGLKGTELKEGVAPEIDRTKVARYGAEAMMQMVFEHGYFHADPHLGNIICLPDNRIAFIDFGMVGRLSDQRREEIINLFYALMKKNPQGAVGVLLDWVPNNRIDEQGLSLEIDAFLDHYHGRTLKQLNLAAMLTELTTILREHQLVLPPDLALLFKALISVDGVGRKLDPDFNIVDVASPFLLHIIRQRYYPGMMLKRGVSQTTDLIELLAQLPADLKDLMRSVKRGGLQMNVDLTRLDHFGHQLDRAASRMTIGLVIAALIVGTAIVSSIDNQPSVFGLPAWGFFGFLMAAFMGLLLLFSIWRGDKY